MITLFIPTMNRSDYLIRLLRYYRDVGFEGPICIGDSSDSSYLEPTKEAIRGLRGGLDIVYREFPGLDGVQCAQQLLELVSTPYATLTSDDDFLVPSALERCIQFLDKHSDYSAVHGHGALLSVESNAPHGWVKGAGYYRQPSVVDGSASMRLINFMRNYSPIVFSVHRTQTWREMYEDAQLVADWKRFGGELLQGCLSVIEGKVKDLDYLQVVRQVYDPQHSPLDTSNGAIIESQRPINMSASSTPHGFDWLTSPDWLPSYQIFRDRLTEELARQDSISVEEAGEVVKEAFWSYLATSLNRKWQDRYAPANGSPRSWLRRTARATPGLHRAWRGVRSFLPGDDNRMSVAAMLRGSSPYHADFMPIYHAITTQPNLLDDSTSSSAQPDRAGVH